MQRLCLFDPPGEFLKRYYVIFWSLVSAAIGASLEVGRSLCGTYDTYNGRMFLLVASTIIIPILTVWASRKHLDLERLLAEQERSDAIEVDALNVTRSIYLTPFSAWSTLAFITISAVGLFLMWKTPYPPASYCSHQIIFWSGCLAFVVEAAVVGIAIKAAWRLYSIDKSKFRSGFYLTPSKVAEKYTHLIALISFGGILLYITQLGAFWSIGATSYMPVTVYLLVMALFPLGFICIAYSKIDSAAQHARDVDNRWLAPLLNSCINEVSNKATDENIRKLNALMSVQEKLEKVSRSGLSGMLTPALLSAIAGLGQGGYVIWKLFESGMFKFLKD